MRSCGGVETCVRACVCVCGVGENVATRVCGVLMCARYGDSSRDGAGGSCTSTHAALSLLYHSTCVHPTTFTCRHTRSFNAHLFVHVLQALQQ